MVNTVYAFYWDITVDWQLIQPGRQMRMDLQFSKPAVYYAAIVADFLVRFSWSVRLRIEVQDFTPAGYIMELAEILRRWMWVIFRLEREWVGRGFGRLGSYLGE
jgi:hypothetical protein